MLFEMPTSCTRGKGDQENKEGEVGEKQLETENQVTTVVNHQTFTVKQ
jgi:hypothetical protein